MNIHFHLDGSESKGDLHALAMLIASLGGRTGPLLDSLHAELHNGAELHGGAIMGVDNFVRDEPPAPAPLAPPPPPSNGPSGDSPAPAASIAPPPAPGPSSSELDSAGLPWDERIHSSSKNKQANGTWKYMRGVDKTIIPGIEAELRARIGGAAPLAPPPPPPTESAAPAAAPPAPVADAATTAASAPPPPPPAAATGGSTKFADMPAFVTFVSSKGLPYAELTAAAMGFGKPTFQEVTKDPTVWDGFVESFGWEV